MHPRAAPDRSSGVVGIVVPGVLWLRHSVRSSWLSRNATHIFDKVASSAWANSSGALLFG